MRYYKVLHDFTAEDGVELSVKKGEQVCEYEGVEQDGWIKVEIVNDSRRRGFVPASYLRETTLGGGEDVAANSNANQSPQSQSRKQVDGNQSPASAQKIDTYSASIRMNSHSNHNNNNNNNNNNSNSAPRGERTNMSAVNNTRDQMSSVDKRVQFDTSNSPSSFSGLAAGYGDALQQMLSLPSSASDRADMQSYGASAQSSASNRAQTQSQSQQSQRQVHAPAGELYSSPQQFNGASPSSDAAISRWTTGPVNSTLLSDSNAVIDAFMKNEVYFKQLMKQRSEALSRMQNSLDETASDVASCKEMNAVLARKLRDLDQTIEKERSRWQERIQEERKFVQRALLSSSSSSNPTGQRN